jgi:hypothetical protein
MRTFAEQVALHEARGMVRPLAEAAARIYLRDRIGRFRDMPDLMPSGRVRRRTEQPSSGAVAHDVRYTASATSRPGGVVQTETLSPLHTTWNEQRKLDDLRWDRSDALNELVIEGNGRMVGSPREREQKQRIEDLDRQIAEQAARVERLQKEAGGRVFRVPDENIEALREKLEKLNKRATKIGVPPVTLKVTDDTYEEERKRVNGAKLVVPYRFVVVSGDTPKHEGWVFAATLDRTEGKDEVSGIVIRRVPTLGDDDDSYIGSLDLDRFRHSANHCDQCGYNRVRNHTYVVANQERGEVKQVGSECIKDFLGGASPDSIAKHAEWLQDLVDEFDGQDRDEGFGGGSSATARPATEDYLGHVAMMIRKNGYKARWYHGERNPYNTADDALSNLWNMANRVKDRQGVPLWEEPTQEDYEVGKAALEWARENVVAKTEKSEFEHNISIYAGQAYLGEKGEGFIAYLPEMHKREREKAVQRKVKEEREAKVRAESKHVGAVGERHKFERLTVTRVGTYEGNYGTTYPTNLEDEDGNQYLWWASNPTMEAGEVVTFMGRIKAHGTDRRSGAAVTQITRPTKIEVVGHVEGDTPKEDTPESLAEEFAGIEWTNVADEFLREANARLRAAHRKQPTNVLLKPIYVKVKAVADQRGMKLEEAEAVPA